nr:7-cyano-7-deazaguanine synthase [Thermotoga sp. KOL6]
MEDIKNTVKEGKLYVAFSGGKDSSLVAVLAKMALGPERVELVTVDWGPYTYEKSREIVRKFAQENGLKHTFIPSNGLQEKVWRFGPSCNACTRDVKTRLVKTYAGNHLVASGANASDSWGKTGLKIFDGVYSPLYRIGKPEINAMIGHLGINVKKIGESAGREGCKLKHLLKMLINPNYHGKAVSSTNEILLDILEKHGIKPKLANVKIVGPLSKNIALVNVKPSPPKRIMDEIIEKLSKEKVVDKVDIVDRPLKLVVLANPSIYRNEEARKWIKEGRLQPEFAFPIVEIEWRESRNNKLRTFQVIDYSKE